MPFICMMTKLSISDIAHRLTNHYHSANWEKGIERIEGVDSFFYYENNNPETRILKLGSEGQQILDNPVLMKEIGETVYKADTKEKLASLSGNVSGAKARMDIFQKQGYLCFDLFDAYLFNEAKTLEQLKNHVINTGALSHYFGSSFHGSEYLVNREKSIKEKRNLTRNQKTVNMSRWEYLEADGLNPRDYVVETDEDFARYGNILVDVVNSTIGSFADNKYITINPNVRDEVLHKAQIYKVGDITGREKYDLFVKDMVTFKTKLQCY